MKLAQYVDGTIPGLRENFISQKIQNQNSTLPELAANFTSCFGPMTQAFLNATAIATIYQCLYPNSTLLTDVNSNYTAYQNGLLSVFGNLVQLAANYQESQIPQASQPSDPIATYEPLFQLISVNTPSNFCMVSGIAASDLIMNYNRGKSIYPILLQQYNDSTSEQWNLTSFQLNTNGLIMGSFNGKQSPIGRYLWIDSLSDFDTCYWGISDVLKSGEHANTLQVIGISQPPELNGAYINGEMCNSKTPAIPLLVVTVSNSQNKFYFSGVSADEFATEKYTIMKNIHNEVDNNTEFYLTLL